MSYFTDEELACQHCGKQGFRAEHLEKLNAIREACGFPFIVSSGYRCEDHPIEAQKVAKGGSVGEHSLGSAVDIACEGEKAVMLLYMAQVWGVKRIGVNQKGSNRFIHLGFSDELPTPALWSY